MKARFDILPRRGQTAKNRPQSAADLELLKQRAVEEGLPYQTLIASLLHTYVIGSVRSAGSGEQRNVKPG
jgi:predicted DNA binding CopG/RHH family protein